MDILINRLREKGVHRDQVYPFFRNMAHVISLISKDNISEINRQLHLLGWNEVELDEHTLDLALAAIEFHDLSKNNLK